MSRRRREIERRRGIHWRRPGRRAPARVAVGAAACLVVAFAVAAAGCAGELPTPGQTSSTVATVSTSTTESQTVELGTQIGAAWSEAIQKLVPMLEGTPPMASLQTPVAQLKEEYVQKMVALGRQVQTLDAERQQEVYDRAQDILDATANADWFTRYVTLYDQYAAHTDQASQDFAILLSTFNTLTEYAFFDVLKEQDPDEASRLGIQ
jgi:hypothetical protein